MLVAIGLTGPGKEAGSLAVEGSKRQTSGTDRENRGGPLSCFRGKCVVDWQAGRHHGVAAGWHGGTLDLQVRETDARECGWRLRVIRDWGHLAAATGNGLSAAQHVRQHFGSRADPVERIRHLHRVWPRWANGRRRGTEDDAVCAWMIKNDRLEKMFSSRPHRIGVTSIAYSSDRKKMGEG